MKTRDIKYAWALLIIAFSNSACNQKQIIMEKGSYGYDVSFLEKHGVGFVEISAADNLSRILLVPGWQGRIMTSTANGTVGRSYGWINYDFIKQGVVSDQFNVYGGEERFWIGPEGGKYSVYFDEGKEQVFENWRVPAFIDTEAFTVINKTDNSVSMESSAVIRNASGFEFDLKVNRNVSILNADDIHKGLGIQAPEGLKMVAYQTENQMINKGTQPWTRENGLLSIWLLCMFSPSPAVTVFIPYNTDSDLDSIAVVNDEYFGKVPSERLLWEKGMMFFSIDGNYRSKIGVPAGRAKNICGSYDAENKILTIVWFNLPETSFPYVNSNWGEQNNPYNGDVVNSYNDGPLEDGSILGPFYEIETSSPGAELKNGETITHIQKVYHFEGEEDALSPITQKLFGISIADIKNKFK